VKARLTPEADQDAQHAISWYDHRDSDIGNEFLQKINDCITSIEQHPEQFPIVYRQMRRALVKRFPYEILFEIEHEEIIIYAIYHCARNPETWKRRRDA
jgi:plasmid stabilization system protein ParE